MPVKTVSEMEISGFDRDEDAYWWLLCIEKYFSAKGTLETEKMTEVMKAMRGRALQWWLWWYQRHSYVSWEPFTIAFLWSFKPEFQDVLPILDEEKEPNLESWNFVLTSQTSFSSPWTR
ncbi:hypothetical protein E2542_SST11474 [Spatholobus suberectus]|nr:hypothetical protein E2542_SST11474 [Spatholobus suberectus]